MTLAELAEASGARLVLPDAGATLVDGPVVADSRQCGPGSLYVARVGEQADGHAFIPAAVAAGAVAALGERGPDELAAQGISVKVPMLVHDDVQTAFGRVAHAVLTRAQQLRGARGLPVVAITGSSGKTSTKDLLAAVLATREETVAPQNSLNGEIGVPLTICRITPSTDALVLEMGARGVGHIAYLTSIAQPQVSVVLNVGSAHVGEFGSREAIAVAKRELVEALPVGGLAVLNADDPLVSSMASAVPAGARVMLVGEAAQADLRAADIALDSQGRASFRLVTPAGEQHVSLRLHGRHHVGNALAVSAVALELGFSLPEVASALSSAGAGSRWRMEVTRRDDGITIVNDAYNANPESMRAGLEALAAMAVGEHGRRVAVLGGMLELGADTVALHEQVGALAAVQADVLVTVGALGGHIADGALAAGMDPDRVLRTEESQAAYSMLQRVLRRGDLVLLKSSRDSGLRWLGDRLADQEGSRADPPPEVAS